MVTTILNPKNYEDQNVLAIITLIIIGAGSNLISLNLRELGSHCVNMSEIIFERNPRLGDILVSSTPFDKLIIFDSTSKLD